MKEVYQDLGKLLVGNVNLVTRMQTDMDIIRPYLDPGQDWTGYGISHPAKYRYGQTSLLEWNTNKEKIC